MRLSSPAGFVQGAHSALDPASHHAHRIDWIWDVMLLTAVLVFVLVVAALLWAAFRRHERGTESLQPTSQRRLGIAVLSATGVTIVILFGVLLGDLAVGRELTANPQRQALQIQITGHQWWWEVRYRDSLPQNWVTTANEIHVPVGQPVILQLRSADVIHSLWPPNLGVKRDLIPGDENSIWFEAESAGVYRGQCAEFCGYQHAKMGFLVIAEPPEQFAGWLARQRDTAATPLDSLARRGQEVFLSSSCVLCHAIAGTPAGSHVGPDLTHLASRQTIAAGTLPNTRGNLAGWILDPQRIKPGALMPPNRLSADDLQALLAYLESLK